MKKRMLKCYIAGKISGLNLIEAKENFLLAYLAVGSMGLTPVNPMMVGLPAKFPWWAHMIYDICLLIGCRYVYFQPNWVDSRGAKIEHRVAKFLNKITIYAN